MQRLQRIVGIEAADYLVVGGEEGAQVVCHFGVVVHHQQGGLLLAGAGLVLGRLRGGGQREGFRLVALFRCPFVFGIRGVVHGQDEGEHGAASLFGLAGFQLPVVQYGQAAGVVQADARSPVVGTFGLVAYLVIAFEYLLYLVFGDALSRVGHGHFDVLRDAPVGGQAEEPRGFLTVYYVEADTDFTALGRELQGIGHQVVEYLFHLVLVQPHQEGVFQSVGVQVDALVVGVHPEDAHLALQAGDEVGALHLQAQGVVLQLVEVHHLVDEPQHAVHAALQDVQQVLVRTLYLRIGAELVHGTGNHGERCAELVRDVGEEAHVHPVHPLLLLLFQAGAAGGLLFGADAEQGTQEEKGEGGCQQEVEQVGPPRAPGGRIYADADGVLGLHDAPVVVGDFHVEHILSGRQVGVVGFVVVAGVYPVVVESLQVVLVVHSSVLAVVQGGEGDAEAVLVVLQVYVGAVGEVLADGFSVQLRTYQAVVYLQVAEQQWDVALDGHVDGVEERKAVRAAEDERAVGQTARGAVVELVSAYAVGGVIVGEASGCPVIFAQSVLGAYPEVALQVFLDARYVEAGGAGHGCHPARFGMVAHQAIAYGAYPENAVRVFVQGRGDEYGAAYAGFQILFRDVRRACRQVFDVDMLDGLVEARHHQPAVVHHRHAGHEGEPLEELHRLEFLLAGAQGIDVDRGGAYPDGSVGRLGDGHGQENPVPFLYLQLPVGRVACLQHFIVGDGHP